MNSTPDFVLDIIRLHHKENNKILEIGCGPAFLREFFPNDYIGADITDELYNENLKRDVDIVCSAEKLLLDDDSVDIVVIKSSFYLFSNHDIALSEAKRVLKKGGIILIFDYTRRTQKRLQKQSKGSIYPCWTQWGLKKKIDNAGFTESKILSSNTNEINFIRKIKQEIFDTWIIVQGIK